MRIPSTSVARSCAKMISRDGPREYEFVPRIINPVKMRRALFLTGEAELRQSKQMLEENMPWLKVEILSDPLSAARTASEEAAVVLCDDAGLAVLDGDMVRLPNPVAVLVLPSLQLFIQSAPPQAARQRFPYAAKADLVFAVNQG